MSRRERLEALLSDDPDDVFLRYALAMEDVAEGNTAAALAGLDDVLARDADYVAAYFQKGQLLAREGDLDPARECLRQGIDVARRVGDAHAESEMTGFLESL